MKIEIDVEALVRWAQSNSWVESRFLVPRPNQHVPLHDLFDYLVTQGVEQERIADWSNEEIDKKISAKHGR